MRRSRKRSAQGADLGLTVAMPRDSFTDAALENLRKLVDAKGSPYQKGAGG